MGFRVGLGFGDVEFGVLVLNQLEAVSNGVWHLAVYVDGQCNREASFWVY